jgi:Short C-terminal domain
VNVGRMSIVSFSVFLVGILGLAAIVGAHAGGAVIVAYVAIVILSFVYAMYLWIAVIRYGDRRLLKRGVKGTAQVSSAKETSWAMSAGEYEGIGAPTVWKYGLDVTVPDKAPYQTTLYICAHLETGETLPVYVSRMNPKRVTIDLAAQAAARASARAVRDGRTKVRVVTDAFTPAPAPDVADELTKLADLRDRGALSDAEFEAQKAKLLESD